MRRLIVLIATAVLTVSAVAFADDESQAPHPIVLTTPSSGSDLPDLGSPAEQMISGRW